MFAWTPEIVANSALVAPGRFSAARSIASRFAPRGARLRAVAGVVDRVYLVERHVPSQAELQGLAAEYAQRSETCGIPAILATLRTADNLADAVA